MKYTVDIKIQEGEKVWGIRVLASDPQELINLVNRELIKMKYTIFKNSSK
jgi:hypothetical protein